VRADAEVRTTGEGQMPRGVAPTGVEAVWVREHRGVTVRPGEGDRDEIAAPDGRSFEGDVAGGVPVNDRGRGFQAQRLLDDVPGHRLLARAVARAAGTEDMQERVADHPFGGLDPAEENHGRVRHDLVRAEGVVPGGVHQERSGPGGHGLAHAVRQFPEGRYRRTPLRGMAGGGQSGDRGDDVAVPRKDSFRGQAYLGEPE
jgi:hypothetical protein